MVHVVCLDRDGTINRDENYFLGSSDNWREQVEILPGVSEGIRKLNESGAYVFIVTNQAGVSLADERFINLTEERVREVNDYIIELLLKQGARVDGCVFCPFVDNSYVAKSNERGWVVDSNYVVEGHRDLKPNIGLVERVVSSLGKKIEDCDVYVVGDRKSDVELGLNAGGRGILVAGHKTRELGDVEKVSALDAYGRRAFICDGFSQAADKIISFIS